MSRLGLTGAALGTLLPYGILNVGLMIPLACRSLDLPVTSFARAVLPPAFLAAAPAVALAVVIRTFAPPSSLTGVMGASFLVAFAFAAMIWRIGLPPSDRVRYAASLKRLAFPTLRTVAAP